MQCTYPLAGLLSVYRFHSDTAGVGRIVPSAHSTEGLSPTIKPTTVLQTLSTQKRVSIQPAQYIKVSSFLNNISGNASSFNGKASTLPTSVNVSSLPTSVSRNTSSFPGNVASIKGNASSFPTSVSKKVTIKPTTAESTTRWTQRWVPMQPAFRPSAQYVDASGFPSDFSKKVSSFLNDVSKKVSSFLNDVSMTASGFLNDVSMTASNNDVSKE
ncbi:hypothetical protein FQN60_007225, partial [Etheostoma spectabile]